MTETGFWSIIEQSRNWKVLDPKRLPPERVAHSDPCKEETFIQNLATYSIDEILSFGAFWQHHWKRTNRRDLAAAAALIYVGISDDLFYNGVQPGAILLGQNTFEALIKDPDTTLSELPYAGAELDEGEFCHVVFDAFELRTGESLHWDDLETMPPAKDPPDRAIGWKEEDLPRLFPKLWSKHKHKWKSMT